MTTDEAIALRKALGLTPAGTAMRLGLDVQSWQEIEAGKIKLERIHELALERIALSIAAEQDRKGVLPRGLREEVLVLREFFDRDFAPYIEVIEMVMSQRPVS